MKELKIEAPQGYEVDKENSTFDCIKFKKKYEIKTWDDFCEAEKKIEGFFISTAYGNVNKTAPVKAENNRNVFLTEKEAKSARAAAMISQLMPYYGGAITDEEWKDCCMRKFVITRSEYGVHFVESVCWFHFLAFRTEKQRGEFYKYNKQLVKEYLMIE